MVLMETNQCLLLEDQESFLSLVVIVLHELLWIH